MALLAGYPGDIICDIATMAGLLLDRIRDYCGIVSISIIAVVMEYLSHGIRGLS